MADTSDVQAALVRLAGSILYPVGLPGVGGYDQAGGYDLGWLAYGDIANLAASSAAGLPVRIYRGWPVAEQLDTDLANAIAHVTVFEQIGTTRLTGGNLDPEISVSTPCTLTASVAGNTITFSGSCSAGQLAGVEFGGASWYYRVQSTDTPLTVAQALSVAIDSGALTSESGAALGAAGSVLSLGNTTVVSLGTGGAGVLTIGTTQSLTARTGQTGQTIKRTREQEEGYQIICWAPDPTSRDTICSTLDAVLSNTRWLQLPDQAARLVWHGTHTDDVPSKARLWRRYLTYSVRYWTTQITAAPPMLFGGGQVSGVSFGDVTPSPTTLDVLEDQGGNLLTDSSGNLVGVYTA